MALPSYQEYPHLRAAVKAESVQVRKGFTSARLPFGCGGVTLRNTYRAWTSKPLQRQRRFASQMQQPKTD